jgi:hypothetical protein
MKSAFCPFAVIAILGAGLTQGPSISYFTNVRDLRIAQADRQTYFVVDEEIWTHARPDLADLRVYDGESQVQYALSEQRGGTSSHETAAKILNLGSVGGRTEFDLDMGEVGEYDRIRLQLNAKDFVATASLAGSNQLGAKPATQLPPATLYDFAREELGSNPVLKLPPSSFRYLHVRLSAGITPAQVKSASVYNLQETKSGLDQRGIMRRTVAGRAGYRDHLRFAGARSGGAGPLSDRSEAGKFSADGRPLGCERAALRGRRNHAGADESRRRHRHRRRDECVGSGTEFRPAEGHRGQWGQSAVVDIRS